MAKARKNEVPSAGEMQPEAFWQRFLQSVGGAALISALLGTLLSGYINAATVERAKITDAERKALELRLAAYNEYLDQQLDVVLRASGLMDRCVAASDELIALTDPAFDPSRYPGVENQRTEMRKKFNECAREWNAEYNKLNLLMGHYHGGQPGVVTAWGEVQLATDDYMGCAQRWYVSNNTTPVDTDGVCKSEKDERKRRVEEFTRQVSAARQYVWQELRASARHAEGELALRRPGQVALVEE